jgi:hypothetical protein
VQGFTDDFSTWWTGDTAIATANRNSIHGVAGGTTNHYAESDPMYWGVRKAFNSCPISRPQTTAGTNVCDFTIAPTSGTAQDCTKGKMNSLSFNAIPSPVNPTSCTIMTSKSSCVKTSSTGAIELVVGTPECSDMLRGVGATAQYFAGPPPESGSVGTITQGFTVNFGCGKRLPQCDRPD